MQIVNLGYGYQIDFDRGYVVIPKSEVIKVLNSWGNGEALSGIEDRGVNLWFEEGLLNMVDEDGMRVVMDSHRFKIEFNQ